MCGDARQSSDVQGRTGLKSKEKDEIDTAIRSYAVFLHVQATRAEIRTDGQQKSKRHMCIHTPGGLEVCVSWSCISIATCE